MESKNTVDIKLPTLILSKIFSEKNSEVVGGKNDTNNNKKSY